MTRVAHPHFVLFALADRISSPWGGHGVVKWTQSLTNIP